MQIFDEIPPAHSNYFRLRLSPEVVISTGVRVKRAGDDMRGEDVALTARHQHVDEKSPYERLLGDAIRRDAGLFTSDAAVEAAWRVADPVPRDHPAAETYAPRPRGPPPAPAPLHGDEGRPDPHPQPPPHCQTPNP